MKTKMLRKMALGALTALALVAGFTVQKKSGIGFHEPEAQATLPLNDRQIIDRIANDYQYAPVLENLLDPVYSLTFSRRGVLLGSNDVITIQSKDASRAHGNYSSATAAAYASFLCWFYSDSKGYTPVAIQALTQGTNGFPLEVIAEEYFEAITNSSGKVSLTVRWTSSSTKRQLECQLPTGKLTRSAY
jgi:hypothetical protein